ncbi:MAG: hypothetical protein K6B71_02110 [Alphaproteobacteria bacterium]|nr:hypothetical protein [Alphaproteobacteria bacterium]
MKQITAIFGGNLERVKPMPKILSVSLIVFSMCLPAFGEDLPEDCVRSPYDGNVYCCNRFENDKIFDQAGYYNEKYDAIIPWDKYKGTVKKCEGSFFEDDEWVRYIGLGSQQEKFIEYETVTNNKIMYYSEYDESNKVWRKPKCNEEYKTLNIHCSIGTNTKGTYADFVHPQNGYNLRTANSINYIYKCEESKLPHLKEYIATVMGKEVIESKNGDINFRSFDKGLLVGVDICINSQWQPYTLCTPFSESKFKEKFPADNRAVNNLGSYHIDTTNNCISFPALEELSPPKEEIKKEKTAEESSSENSESADSAAESEKETATESEESSSETGIQYDYQQCESNSDCTREKLSDYLSGNPYLHSTEWYCIEQSAGNKVCASKACENGYHIAKYANGNSKGFCEKDAPVQPNANEGQSGRSGANGSASSANVNNKTNDNSEPHDTDKKLDEIKKLTEKINKTYTELQGLTKNLSEWKNTEGKFNTARLASDSTAAVVLGTVGGVVTAKLVKKSQVKKGFESLQCYIGGQPIAAYGDEVTIGR